MRHSLSPGGLRRWFLPGLLPLVVVACGAPNPSPAAADSSILLFAGRGTSPNDVAALERILRERRWSYSTASSEGLDAISDTELHAHRLLIVPGGNFERIGDGLRPGTTTRVRDAVGNGLNYLGLCAGAFFAGASPSNGLNLTAGVRFPFYALEERGVRKAAVTITTAEGPPLDHYWEDGPQLTGWGDAVARYPDGTPAVVQGEFGKGWVVLSGIHPEAPESWRHGMKFATPASESNAYAATLVDAALNARRLAHY